MRIRNIDRASYGATRAGFTLLELLVVVAILLVLGSVATTIYIGYAEKAKKDLAYSKANTLAGDLRLFAAANDGQYPVPGDWSPLPLKPEDNPPLDSWGRPFNWTVRELPGIGYDPIVWSMGPNGIDEQGGGDDISNLARPN